MEALTSALIFIVIACPIFLILTFLLAEREADALEKHLDERWENHKQKDEE